jgi:hypothetical protein
MMEPEEVSETAYNVNMTRIMDNGQYNNFTLNALYMPLPKGCHLDVVRGPSTPHDPESDAGGSLSSWQSHPSQ